MKQDRSFPQAYVTQKGEIWLRGGHPWVYEAELERIKPAPENGALVDVLSGKGRYIGTGFYSEKSRIRIRLLDRNANEGFGEAFFRRRVKYALDYRAAVMGRDFGCCRLIYGEADGLPGLTVDRYGALLSAQVLSYGMEQRKDVVYRAVCDYLAARGEPVRGIYERNESSLRELEGLVKTKGWYVSDYIAAPESPVTEICENGIRYSVDLENGQKTGFFLDQKYNRLAVQRLAEGRRVLDCFTHTGSFALNAAAGGAEHVTAVDISAEAVEMARRNAEKNGLAARMDFICDDVFRLLPELGGQRGRYDFIILDPPAFTKSRRTVDSARRGYKEINYRAMRLLPRGGFLATCSCSHFMTEDLFRQMLLSAAADAGVSLKLIEARRQGPDHPILMNVPETDYLKFYLVQVV